MPWRSPDARRSPKACQPPWRRQIKFQFNSFSFGFQWNNCAIRRVKGLSSVFFICSIGQNQFASGFYRNDTVKKDATPSLHFDLCFNHKQVFIFKFRRSNCQKQTSHILRRRRKQIARRTQQFKGRSIIWANQENRWRGPSPAPPKPAGHGAPLGRHPPGSYAVSPRRDTHERPCAPI